MAGCCGGREQRFHVEIALESGAALALVAVIVTWNRGLGPHWYPAALVVLALPQSWLGARLFESRIARAPSPG